MNLAENILVEGNRRNPHIDFNRYTGELILSGKSIPENAAKVYEPLLFWIEDYIRSPRPTTNLRLNLEYFNTATSIWLAKMVKSLCKINKEDYTFFIHLYFDIEDFDEMDTEDLKEVLGSLLDNVAEITVNLAIRTYGIDEGGKILKESTVLV